MIINDLIRERISHYSNNITLLSFVLLVLLILFILGFKKRKWEFCISAFFAIPVIWLIIHFGITSFQLSKDMDSPLIETVTGEIESIGGSNIDDIIIIDGIKYRLKRVIDYDMAVGKVFEISYLSNSKYVVDAKEITK